MYYQNYEDYMRQVLGYPMNDPSIYENQNYGLYGNTYVDNSYGMNFNDEEISNLYPQSFHLLNPYICRVCDSNNEPITKELIDRMTDEVYSSIERSNIIINLGVQQIGDNTISANNNSVQNSSDLNNRTDISNKRDSARQNKELQRTERRIDNKDTLNRNEENNRQARQNNNLLRDLIRILILNRLVGGGRPNPPRPPRPPYPGRPGNPPFPGERPPIGPF